MEGTISEDGGEYKALGGGGVDQDGGNGGAAKIEVISGSSDEKKDLDQEGKRDGRNLDTENGNDKITRKDAGDNSEEQEEANLQQEGGDVQVPEKEEPAVAENREEIAKEADGKKFADDEEVVDKAAVKERHEAVEVEDSAALVDKMVPVAEEEQPIEIKEATDGVAASKMAAAASTKDATDDEAAVAVPAEVDSFGQEKSDLAEQTAVLLDHNDEVPVLDHHDEEVPVPPLASSEDLSRDSIPDIAANGGSFENAGTAEKTKSGLRGLLSWCFPDLERFDTHAWASGLALGIIVTCSAIIISKKLENKGT